MDMSYHFFSGGVGEARQPGSYRQDQSSITTYHNSSARGLLASMWSSAALSEMNLSCAYIEWLKLDFGNLRCVRCLRYGRARLPEQGNLRSNLKKLTR